MSSAAVRQAMVTASVGNVRTCASLDQKAGIIWTTAPVADVLNVLDELKRLQERLEAVCGVVSDAAAFGEGPEAGKIMEAVRGD